MSDNTRAGQLGINPKNLGNGLGNSGSYASQTFPEGAPVPALTFDPDNPNINFYLYAGRTLHAEIALDQLNDTYNTDHKTVGALIEDLTARHPAEPWLIPVPLADRRPGLIPEFDALDGAIGYTFQADIYGDWEIVDQLTGAYPDEVRDMLADGVARNSNAFVAELAHRLNIDITDESNYDSDEFPKPIYTQNSDGSTPEVQSYPGLGYEYWIHNDQTIRPDDIWDEWYLDALADNGGDDGPIWFYNLTRGIDSYQDVDDNFDLIRKNAAEYNLNLDELGVPLPTRHNYWQLTDGTVATGEEAFDQWCGSWDGDSDDNLFNALCRNTDGNRIGVYNLKSVEQEAARLGVDLTKLGAPLPKLI